MLPALTHRRQNLVNHGKICIVSSKSVPRPIVLQTRVTKTPGHQRRDFYTEHNQPIVSICHARRLSENQVKPDKDLRRTAGESIFEFSGKTTFCHVKKRRKLFLPIALILGQAPSYQTGYSKFDSPPFAIRNAEDCI